MPRPWSGRRARLRTVLLVVVLVPVLGMATVSALVVADRWRDRDASIALRSEAAELRAAIEVRTVVGDEDVRSTIVALASDLGVDVADFPDLIDISGPAALAASQSETDRLLLRLPEEVASRSASTLHPIREQLVDGTATFQAVSQAFQEVTAIVDDWLARKVDVAELVADRRPMPAEVRVRLRALRASVEVLTEATTRAQAGLQVLFGTGGDRHAERLLEAVARFDAAAERAEPSLGDRGRGAWAALASSATAQRTEAVFEQARQVALGRQDPFPITDLALLGAGLVDGFEWAVLINDLGRAAASDLEAAADEQVAGATRAAGIDLARALIVALASIGLVLLIARLLVRPAVELEAGARRVEHGDFDLPPVVVRGPREVAGVVQAFNDMAATLAAIEEHAVAMADDPGSPVLDTPLPGRTGQALQVAIDKLKASIQVGEQHRAELHELATRDGLTGLLNRTAAFAAVTRDLAAAARDGNVVTAIYLDLDDLKVINDTYGHDGGDEAIRRTADLLMATTRRSDVVARLGGDEFLVADVVPAGAEGVEQANALAERVQAAFAAAMVRVGGEEGVPLRASIGVAMSGPGIDTVEALVRAADGALYEAKRTGRGRVAWHRDP